MRSQLIPSYAQRYLAYVSYSTKSYSRTLSCCSRYLSDSSVGVDFAGVTGGSYNPRGVGASTRAGVAGCIAATRVLIHQSCNNYCVPGRLAGSFYSIILIVFLRSDEYYDGIKGRMPPATFSFKESIEVATYGGYNAHISYNIHPKLQISTFSLQLRFSRSSGAMYKGVPTFVLAI